MVKKLTGKDIHGTSISDVVSKVGDNFEGGGSDIMTLEVNGDADSGTITANYSVAEVTEHFQKKPVYCCFQLMRRGETVLTISGMMSPFTYDTVNFTPALLGMIIDTDSGEEKVAPFVFVEDGEWSVAG